MLFPLLAAAVGLLSCLLLGRNASTVVRIMPPAQAVALLSVVSVVLALATGIALTAIAVAVGARIAVVAAEGHWSVATLQAEVPIPAWLGSAAVVTVGVLLLRAAHRTSRIVLALVRAERLCRTLRAAGPVIIVDDNSVDAFTIAGLKGCVVISARLLNALPLDERRVLTAHELSHLNRRHHLYLHAADIAAAANPLLHRVSPAVRLGVERWADEDAAELVGNRRLAGRTLARVALLRSRLGVADAGLPTQVRGTRVAGLPTLAAASHQVAVRVQALLEPAVTARKGRLVTAGLAALLVLSIGVTSLQHIHEAIETASWYPKPWHH